MENRSVADAVEADDIEGYFFSAMVEEGVEPDSVEVVSWEQKTTTTAEVIIYTTKYISGEPYSNKVAVTMPNAVDKTQDHLRQQVATMAREVAESIRSEMTEHINVCGTQLTFCIDDGGWAKCEVCDEEVALHNVLKDGCIFKKSAEFSHPAPSPYDIQTFLQRLDEGDRELLKYYLFGALRERCHCNFGKREIFGI